MTFFNILQKTWHNFLERQLFDLIHGTTTYEVVDKADFLPIVDLKHGKAYYASWTNEVKNSHQVLIHLLKNHFTDYVFIDLGCGKGKACPQSHLRATFGNKPTTRLHRRAPRRIHERTGAGHLSGERPGHEGERQKEQTTQLHHGDNNNEPTDRGGKPRARTGSRLQVKIEGGTL